MRSVREGDRVLVKVAPSRCFTAGEVLTVTAVYRLDGHSYLGFAAKPAQSLRVDHVELVEDEGEEGPIGGGAVVAGVMAWALLILGVCFWCVGSCGAVR
jgi:hypothetical protein